MDLDYLLARYDVECGVDTPEEPTLRGSMGYSVPLYVFFQQSWFDFAAKQRDIVATDRDWIHCRMDDGQFRGLEYLYNSRIDQENFNVSFIEEFNNVQIECLDTFNLTTQEFTGKDYTHKVWPPGPRSHTSNMQRINNARIIIDGKHFYLWTIVRWQEYRFRDVFWYTLSYKNEDSAIANKLLNNLDHLHYVVIRDQKIIDVYGGSTIKLNSNMGWGDLVLDDFTIQRTKKDLEGWIKAEDRYRKLNIPYRRGYLFEGPPGNGKTAVAKVMMCNYGFSAYRFDFSNPNFTDSNLEEAFRDASEGAPAIFLMEDIDRVFAKDGTAKSQITLDGLLNCLDGVVSYDGVVVIATANNPQDLDPAIRLRPGRFDVPVRFDNPIKELRRRYFEYVLNRCEVNAVTEECLKYVVNQTDGMSFAYLKSIFEAAATNMDGEKIMDENLYDALDQAKKYYEHMSTSKERVAGFQSGDEERKTRRTINRKIKIQPDVPADGRITMD